METQGFKDGFTVALFLFACCILGFLIGDLLHKLFAECFARLDRLEDKILPVKKEEPPQVVPEAVA